MRWKVAFILLLLVFNYSIGQKNCGDSWLENINASFGYQTPQIKNSQIIEPRNTLVIPVVVHIVYYNELENISNQQIQSQIDVLNADFSSLNVKDYLPESFKDLVGVSKFKFCLANVDPSNEPTNGITRTKTDIFEIGNLYSSNGHKNIHYRWLGGQDSWPNDQYLNIWVCRLSQNLGYATRPGQAMFNEEDGVVIDYRYFGNIETAINNFPHHLGRTCTHEIGHFFGLKHIWGLTVGKCDDNDDIPDTPPQQSPTYGCPINPTFACNEQSMTMNFMDYTDDHCMYLFTKGQIEYMYATLFNYRNDLINQNTPKCIDENLQKINLNVIQLKSTVIENQIITFLMKPSFQEKMKIKLFDVKGACLYEDERSSQQELSIKINQKLPSGFYFVNLTSIDNSKTFKIYVLE